MVVPSLEKIKEDIKTLGDAGLVDLEILNRHLWPLVEIRLVGLLYCKRTGGVRYLDQKTEILLHNWIQRNRKSSELQLTPLGMSRKASGQD